jgi:hypothetical protein
LGDVNLELNQGNLRLQIHWSTLLDCVVCLFVFVGILDRSFQRPNLVNL